jgi:membrane associated rhomboid family serine protease
MLPIGDDDSDRRFAPLINYVLIAINVLVFVFLQGMGGNEKFTYAFSTVPAEILTGKDIAAGVLEPTLYPFISLLLHLCLCMVAGPIFWETCYSYGSLEII